MNRITTSKKFTINWRDIAKALLIAVITPALYIIQEAIAKGTFPSWNEIGIAAVSGAVAYLIKNFFTASQTVIKEPKKDEPTV